MTSGHYFKRWKQGQISFSWALKSLQMVTTAIKSEDECYDKPRQCIEKHSADKGPYSQGYGLSSGHVQL